ncbi:hypothetical protein [Streptomyces sp. AC555_RSS877]|uniref:hypothetical protein n=1 Tax=Streptomyces sp. AC555_RSS877 TaxID=2823688 RepID=UPI0035AB950C
MEIKVCSVKSAFCDLPTFDCDVLVAPGSDLRVVAYTAAAGSDAADRLRLLNVIGTQTMTEDNIR